MIDVSVVVPTFHRAEALERCLDALAAQRATGLTHEIVVADDAVDEQTYAQVRRWRERGVPVRYLAVPGPVHGPAAARNVGWRAARGWLVAFTDDDTVPDPHWIDSAFATFSAHAVRSGERLDAAFGRIMVPLPPHPTDFERDAAGLEGAGFVSANCFVRRDVLDAHGGFDERFTLPWREDSDLYFRLLGAGRRVEFLVDAVVVHPVRPAPWGVSMSQQRKSEFDALLYREHPTLFSRHVRPGRPSLYYAIVLAIGLALVGVGTRDLPLVLASLAAWAALTVVFAARRLRDTSRAPRHVAEMLVTSVVIPPLSLFWRVRGAIRHRVLFW